MVFLQYNSNLDSIPEPFFTWEMLLASYISWVDVESVWENGLSRKAERAPGSHGRLFKAREGFKNLIVIHEEMLFMPISCAKSAACLVIFCCAQCQYGINCVFKILKLVSIVRPVNCKNINVLKFFYYYCRNIILELFTKENFKSFTIL